MNLCNTNRLRVSINRARSYMPATQAMHFSTNDHQRGKEHNWSVVLGPLWLFVKLRPNGKSPSANPEPVRPGLGDELAEKLADAMQRESLSNDGAPK